jgi:predicted O-methyltransferase YrrM
MPKTRKVKAGGHQFIYTHELPSSKETNIWARIDLQPNNQIKSIYKDGFVEINGQKVKLTSAISPAEGFHLYDIIKKNKFKNILEVGMANGLSALYITQALEENGEGNLTSLDPFQSTQWKNVGITNIKKAGLSHRHSLIEKKSYDALPELLNSKKKFDLIFIDGMHLFDYTLVDVFYSILLVNIGGIIIIDDILHKAPSKVIKYIDTNYKCLKRILPIPVKTVATYIKQYEDNRNWDYHQSF